jgi:hypothetical protein
VARPGRRRPRAWPVSARAGSRVDGKRQKKQSAAQILESIAAGGASVWTSGDYKFLFTAKKYFWKGEEIHITAGEELFLYRALVLKERYPQQSSYLYNMRKRLGKEFLAENHEILSSETGTKE